MFNNKMSILLQDATDKYLFYIPHKNIVFSVLDESYYKNIICKITIIHIYVK